MIAPYWLAIKIGVAGLLVALLAYLGHAYVEGEREQARQGVREEYALALSVAKDNAHQRERQLFERIIVATEKGTQREETIRTAAAASAAAAGSLRDTIAAYRNRLPETSPDALRDAIGTYGELLASCEGRRRSVAEEAERLNSEKQTLIDAWPVQ